MEYSVVPAGQRAHGMRVSHQALGALAMMLGGCFSPGQVFGTGQDTSGGSDEGSVSGDPTPPATSSTGGTSTSETTGASASSSSGAFASGSSETGALECPDGFDRCGGDACDVDVLADPEHCGRCGHDCLGGECVRGQCLPASLHVAGDLRDLDVDEDFVFFATGDVCPESLRNRVA